MDAAGLVAPEPAEPAPLTAPAARPKPHWLYPEHYPWFVGLALLDVTLTWIVLGLGAGELNGLAREIITRGGLAGLLLFKLLAVALVIAICQYVGARRAQVGQRVIEFALAVNTVPVTVACLYLLDYSAGLMGA